MSGTQLKLESRGEKGAVSKGTSISEAGAAKASRAGCPLGWLGSAQLLSTEPARAGGCSGSAELGVSSCSSLCSTAPPRTETQAKAGFCQAWGHAESQQLQHVLGGLRGNATAFPEHPQSSPTLLTATETRPPRPCPLPRTGSEQREPFPPGCRGCREPKQQQQQQSEAQPCPCALCCGPEPTAGRRRRSQPSPAPWTAAGRCSSGRNS